MALQPGYTGADDHAPEYIEQQVSRRQLNRPMRFSEHNILCPPRTKRYCGGRAISVTAPSLWNDRHHYE